MNTVIQTRIDDKSKSEAEEIFRQMGMSLNDGIRIFICQVINEKALPFQPKLSRELKDEVKLAIQRKEDYVSGKNCDGFKKFETVDEAMADLLGEDD